jgi:hypothetical protein
MESPPPSFAVRQALATARTREADPEFARPDKAELPGWNAPYQEQDDGPKATSIWGSLLGEGGAGGGQGP